MIKLYGLKNCDSCRKALKALQTAGWQVDFVDMREAVGESDIAAWLDGLGAEALINRRSTTWRTLSDRHKEKCENTPLPILIENRTLIKRPVIEVKTKGKAKIYLGWNDEIRTSLGL